MFVIRAAIFAAAADLVSDRLLLYFCSLFVEDGDDAIIMGFVCTGQHLALVALFTLFFISRLPILDRTHCRKRCWLLLNMCFARVPRTTKAPSWRFA